MINTIFCLSFYFEKYFYLSCHPFLLTCLLMVFWTSEQKELILKVAQTILLTHYFFVGLHKLISIGGSYQEVVLNFFFERIFVDKAPGLFLSQYIFENVPSLLVFGFSMVIVFQLSALWAIFSESYQKVFIPLVCLFHAFVLNLLGVQFLFTPIAMILFFYILPIDSKIKERGQAPA